ELASIPLLFGMPAARGVAHPEARGAFQEFSAHWPTPGRSLPWTLGAGGALGAAALAELGARELLELGVWVGGGLVLGAGLGQLLGQQRRRSCIVYAQSVRIQVLERAASRRESRAAGSLQMQS